MMVSRLQALASQGQAVWLDYLDRGFLAQGGLARLIEDDGLTGVTSNPSIFEKAIGQDSDYDEQIAELVGGGETSPAAIYEHLAVTDIQAAADALRPVYDRLGGADGFASIEVSPSLARSTQGTIDEARRLWRAVDRPNLMVKVPGTREGVPAVRALAAEGINVNITLLFAIDMYELVAGAFLAGLEERLTSGRDISRVASVASFFVSRVDTAIDAKIDARIAADEAETRALVELRGSVAIANAKLAYQSYLGLIASDRWRSLAQQGARPQRLLWASTGTKDPAFSDVYYVETLIGRDTVNTMPPKTIDAFRDHGVVAPTLTANLAGERHVLAEADRLGLDLRDVTASLVAEGVEKFSNAADALLRTIDKTRAKLATSSHNTSATTAK
jgi:transaldolase/glucose-6-phosphate isomerase